MIHKGSRSSHLVMERALAMLARLLEGEASRQQLIGAVRQAVEAAYGQSPEDSFHRDLRLLRSLGFQIGCSRSRRAYFLESFDHPVLKLHLPAEALEALITIRSTFRGLPHAERIEALISVIEARLPSRSRRMLHRESLPSYAFAPADEWQTHSQSLQVVEWAIEGNQQLEFLYRSPKRPKGTEPKHHVVEPYNLEYREGHLYFEGYHLRLCRVYPYRVDRIVPGSAKVLPDKFMPRERLHSWVEIRYRLAPEIARYGASRRFINQREEKQEDGSVIVTAEVPNLFEALKKLLKYGSGCQVLGPPELVDLVQEEAQKMIQIYERPSSRLA
ncbi:MAG: helix-turn-helix transcriptional regulator [bacterium]